MSNIPTYSGFLSLFTSSSSSTATYTDIMSTVVTTTAEWNYTSGSGASGTYDCGYMCIGELLVQFSISPPLGTNALPLTNGSGNTIAIEFPTDFHGYPYCVLANPVAVSASDNSNYTVTVTGTNSNGSFTAVTGDKAGYIQYIAIGPR